MNKVVLILMALSLSGCASYATKWSKVEVGQSLDDVKGIMGEPDQVKTTADGKHAYGWNYNAYTTCGVAVDDHQKVTAAACGEDQTTKTQYFAFLRGQLQAQQRLQQQNSAVVQNYQQSLIRDRTQTNCTTSMIGGYATTHCSSY